jgi:phosphate starvation-inducible membrane PsiE
MQNAKHKLDRLGNSLVSGFQIAALFVIGATIVWSAAHDYSEMIRIGRVRLDDILLLFIYLELGTMVGIYFKTERLPVLFLLYIAITAMTRFLVIDGKALPIESLLIVTGSILVLTFAVMVLQIANSKFTISNQRTESNLDIDSSSDGGASASREPQLRESPE